MADLVLGPLLRYVSETEATVWVETERALRGRGPRPPRADLRASTATTTRWSGSRGSSRAASTSTRSASTASGAGRAPGADLPPSAIRTLEPGQAARHLLRLLPGRASRTSAPYTLTKDEDEDGHELDALRVLAEQMIRDERDNWPELLFLLGDQVYVDEGSPRTRERIRARRGTDDAARRGGDRLRGVHLALPASPGRTR